MDSLYKYFSSLPNGSFDSPVVLFLIVVLCEVKHLGSGSGPGGLRAVLAVHSQTDNSICVPQRSDLGHWTITLCQQWANRQPHPIRNQCQPDYSTKDKRDETDSRNQHCFCCWFDRVNFLYKQHYCELGASTIWASSLECHNLFFGKPPFTLICPSSWV